MKVASLTLWMCVALGLLAVLSFSDAQENAADVNADAPAGDEAGADAPTEGEAGADKPMPAEEGSDVGNSTVEEAATSPDQDPSNSTEPEATTQAPEVTKVEKMHTFLATRSSCKKRFDECLAAWANVVDDNDAMCDDFKNQKDCLKEKKNGFECSNDDYDALKDIACHGMPRALVNGLLVSLLPFLAWLLTHK